MMGHTADPPRPSSPSAAGFWLMTRVEQAVAVVVDARRGWVLSPTVHLPVCLSLSETTLLMQSPADDRHTHLRHV